MTSDPVARYLSERAVKSGRRARLRTMGPSEVLDLSLRIYRSLGWSFLRISLVPSLFCLASLAFLFEYVLPSLTLTRDASSMTTQLSEAATSLGLELLIGVPLFLVGIAFTSSLVVRMASDMLLTGVSDEEKARGDASKLLPRLFWLSLREILLSASCMLVSFLLMGLGAVVVAWTPDSSVVGGLIALLGVFAFLAGIAVCLYVLAIHGLAAPVAVLENMGAKKASKRSAQLLKGSAGQPGGTPDVLVVLAAMGLVSLLLLAGSESIYSLVGLREVLENLTIDLPGQSLLLTAADLLPTFLVVWATVPFWAIATTTIYYERRIRLEGYDIEALAADM